MTTSLAQESVRAATAIDAALAGMARDAAPKFSALQRNLVAGMARDAAPKFSALHRNLVAQTAETLKTIDTTKVVDTPGMKKLTETLTQVFPRSHGASPLTAALAGYKLPPVSAELTAALGGIDARSVFNFARTLEDVGPAADMKAIAKAFTTLDLPRSFTASVTDALGRVPTTALTGLAPLAEATLAETAKLAGSTVVAEVAEEAFDEIDEMTLAERRDLQRDLMNAIAYVVTLIGILTKCQRLAVASCLIGFLAVCISIYWRLDRNAGE